MGAILVKVRDARGAPIKDASVALTSYQEALPDNASITDDDGEVRYSALAPGKYEIGVSTSRLLPSRVVVVREGEVVVEFIDK